MRINTTSSPSTIRVAPAFEVLNSLHALCLAGTLLCAVSISTSFATDWPQWRGPARNGISQETGFVKEWPKAGPALVWRVSNIGRGYSTPAVVGDRLYVLGSEGTENEFVEALS